MKKVLAVIGLALSALATLAAGGGLTENAGRAWTIEVGDIDLAGRAWTIDVGNIDLN